VIEWRDSQHDLFVVPGSSQPAPSFFRFFTTLQKDKVVHAHVQGWPAIVRAIGSVCTYLAGRFLCPPAIYA
jgi:hypothetical protein